MFGERDPGKLLSRAPRRCCSCWPGDNGLGLSVIPPCANTLDWFALCNDEILEGASFGELLVG